MPGKYPSNPIDYLLRRKFGDGFATVLSDEDPELAALRADFETYHAELQSLSSDELDMRVCRELENEGREDIEEQARAFNQPSASADFDYWSRLPLWTLDEAVALTLERNPAVVTWAAVKGDVGVSLFAGRFDKLRRHVLRAKEAKQLTDFVSPTPTLPGRTPTGSPSHPSSKRMLRPPEVSQLIGRGYTRQPNSSLWRSRANSRS